MRYGIFSDVHSNWEALEAVLETLRAERADALLCCGDLVGYAAEPEPCVAAVRAACRAVVAGNHDWAAAGQFPREWFHDAARAAVQWTAEQLAPATRECLAALPLTWHDESVAIAHGTFREPEQFHYLFTMDQAAEHLEAQPTPVAFVGHTHVPVVFMRTPEGSVRLLHDPVIRMTPGARYLVNAGSVGQPRDWDPRAACWLYDTARQELACRRVPYAIAAAQHKIRAAGLPAVFADRLARGA